MEVVVMAHVQWQELATPKTVQVSIFSCLWSIMVNTPSPCPHYTDICKMKLIYRISANSFRGNYSFLNLAIKVRKLFKGGNYSRKYGTQLMKISLLLTKCAKKNKTEKSFSAIVCNKWQILKIHGSGSGGTLHWYGGLICPFDGGFFIFFCSKLEATTTTTMAATEKRGLMRLRSWLDRKLFQCCDKFIIKIIYFQ